MCEKCIYDFGSVSIRPHSKFRKYTLINTKLIDGIEVYYSTFSFENDVRSIYRSFKLKEHGKIILLHYYFK